MISSRFASYHIRNLTTLQNEGLDLVSSLAPSHDPTEPKADVSNAIPQLSDDIEGDQREPHNSGEEVDFAVLEKLGLLPHPNIEMDKVEEM